MGDWAIDDRGGVCEQCEGSYQSLSLHWARNRDCSHPTVEPELHDVIRGCLLGDGSLDSPNDGPPALRISSMRFAHIEWIHESLGWLSRGISKDQRGAYRLRTMSHPAFGRYWTWQGSPPDSGWKLSQTIARIWYACDGHLVWPGTSDHPRACWSVTDESKRETIRQRLEELGYEPMVWERRVALSFEETEDLLEWLGPPTPGSDYKWALERDEYERQREHVA